MNYREAGLVLRPFEPAIAFEICIMTPLRWPMSVLSRNLVALLTDEARLVEAEMAALFK